MQQIYLEDYDVNLEFPDQMSEDRIKDIIKRDYPEPDEKLVARFDNPETPSSSLTREDFVRYKQARPDMTWGQVPGVVAEAAVDTAARIVHNLPDAVRTYVNIFDPGTSARAFLEGAARGTYDTEALIQMAKGYIGSKIDAFGGVSEDETTNQYNNFVKLKELQNVRGAIERGDKSAWNEYADWSGMAGAKLDLAKINTQAAELTGEFIDPTFVVPGGKIASKASRAAARTLGAPVKAAGRAASIASEYTGGLIEGAKNRVKGATEIIDEATGGLANVVVPGGVGAAVAGGVVGGGTAGLVGAAVATPTLLDVAGGLLTGFGEAMSHTPTRLGGMARVHMHQPDTIAGKLAGRLQFLDRPVDYAGRTATGAVIGGAVGGGIGLASGGLEGLAQGIGSGGVLGAGGATLGRAVEGLTGASLRNAQDSDYGRWIETKTPDDRERLAGITNREDRIARMDAEQILLQGSATVRHVDPDFEVMVNKKRRKLGKAAGFLGEEDGKPVVYLNVNADARTMLHETFHAMARLDGFDAMVSTIKNTIGRMYTPEQVNDFIRDYENRLKAQIDISQRYQEKMGGSSQAKVDYILEEMGAEYFANFIKGKNSNYIFSGSSFAEGLKGVFDRFTKGKLDRFYDAFQSPIFDQQIRQSRRLDSAMRDLVKARREAGRKVELSMDEPVKTYSAVDLSDDDTFREMEAMGVAKTDRSGKRVIMGDSEQKKIAKERARNITNILDQVGGEGGLTRQPDGSYRGARFSAGQLQALLDSPLINDTIKKALAEYSKINEADQYVNVTYGASTMKTKLGKTRAKNLPISNRNAILYDIVISPITGTITTRVLDMSLTESKASRLYNQTAEMQKIFGSEAQMFLDLHSYINALRSGEKRTAEVLGSQRKSDFLNKILSVRNVKGNPEVPEGTMTARQRRLFEGGKDFPWRSFRLDRIVAMQQKEGRPIVSFSEAAYQRAQTHFMPDVDQYGYRMSHRAPDGTDGEGSIDKMDTVYPEDIYSSKGAMYYGNDDYESRKTIELFRSLRGKPEAELTVYRAVPKGVSGVINPGDWVTTSRKYAELHANYFEETGADILEKKVKAKEVYSEGNSIFEFGWNPKAPGDARFSPGTGRSKSDQDYLKAAKAKDFGRLAGMVDDAARQAGYNSPTLYHGSIDPNLNRLDPRSAVEVEGGVFMTTNEDVAYPYSYERAYGDIISEEPLGKVYTVKTKMQNPLEYVPGMVRGTPKPNAKYIDAVEMSDAIRAAKRAGHDGLIIRNIDDTIGMTGDMSDVYVAFNADQIKSADPITYNDDGSIIPLSERFKDTTDDIRFSPAKLDTDHAKAVQSGDMETAQRLVDEAAKKAGYTVGPVYHGTNSNHQEFKYSKTGRFGKGFYFTTNKEEAARYGSRVITAYLFGHKLFKDLRRPSGGIEVALNPSPVDKRKKTRALYNYGKITLDGGDVILVDDPSQIKSAAPATYDNKGNLIPLSERFNIQSDDIRFSPAADRPSIVQRKLNDPSESGTILNGVVSLTPSVMARFSPATNDPGYDIKQLAGKKAFVMMADRMKVGEYTARSGRVFELRGGPDHPDLADNQGTIAWAVEGGPIASQLERAIRQTDGIGLVVLQKEESVAGNKTYSEVMLEEFKYDMQQNPQIKKDLPQILNKASAMIQKKAKAERLKSNKLEAEKAKAKGKKFTPKGPSKWESFEFKSIEHIEEALPEMTFGGRKTMWQQVASNDYKKKYGGIFWKDMYDKLNAYKDDQGYRTGDIVKVIQFDKSAPTPIINPKDLGLPVHPAYQYGVLGKSISNIKGRLSAFDLLRDSFTNRIDEESGIMKPGQQITPEGKIGANVSRVMALKGLTEKAMQPVLTETSLDPRSYKSPVKLGSDYGAARTKQQEQIRREANRFSPAGERMSDLPSGEGPVMQRVNTPILAGQASNVVSTDRIRKEISSDKKSLVVENTKLDNGKMVGLRLDIPTYQRTMEKGSPVFPISVHEKWAGRASGKAGKIIGYTNIATVENPVFMINEKAAEGIREGKPKTTIATVEGSYRKTTSIPDDIESWTQVSMNPRRHSYFYDRETGRPVVSGDVAISTGNTVFVKNPIFASADQFRFSPQRSLNNRGGAIYTTPEGHRAVQTSSRAGVRVYGPTGRRIGPVFQSVEAAERHLSQQ